MKRPSAPILISSRRALLLAHRSRTRRQPLHHHEHPPDQTQRPQSTTRQTTRSRTAGNTRTTGRRRPRRRTTTHNRAEQQRDRGRLRLRASPMPRTTPRDRRRIPETRPQHRGLIVDAAYPLPGAIGWYLQAHTTDSSPHVLNAYAVCTTATAVIP
jgi:hypothetical protein